MVKLTDVKQIHVQEGSPCPSSASHRPERRCGAREKGSHNFLILEIEYNFLIGGRASIMLRDLY
jgi:hypothetical protein